MWLLLPSIPRGCFLHSDPSQLSNQFLAASTYRLSEFGEGAAALQVTESVLSGTTIHSAGPAGTSIAWSTDRQIGANSKSVDENQNWISPIFLLILTCLLQNKVKIDRTKINQYLLLFCTFYRSKLLFVCSGQDLFVKGFSLSVFPLLQIARCLRENK